MARRHQENDETPMTKRLLKDAAKQPGLIPNGVWELRCVAALKVSEGKEDEDGNPTKIALLTHEPFAATGSVDPEEATATDATGRSLYDGKRIFTRFTMPRDSRRLAQCLLAHGLDGDEIELDAFDIPVEATRVQIRGKLVQASVDRYSYKDKTTGEPRSDNQVKAWAPVA